VHVLVATDGKLDPNRVADFAVRLAGSDGMVTVVTVIEIPRRLLSDLREVMGQMPATEILDVDAEYVDVAGASIETPRAWPGDDAVLRRYLDDKRLEYTGPIADAVREHGIQTQGEAIDSEKTAESILSRAEEIDADVIVIGSHGLGAFEGLLGSVGTKIVRRSNRPVLLLRVS